MADRGLTVRKRKIVTTTQNQRKPIQKKARSGRCHPKKIQDHAALTARCKRKTAMGMRTGRLFLSFQTSQAATAIMR